MFHVTCKSIHGHRLVSYARNVWNSIFHYLFLFWWDLYAGSFCGSLSSLKASDLGSVVIKECLVRANLKPSEVSEVILGQVWRKIEVYILRIHEISWIEKIRSTITVNFDSGTRDLRWILCNRKIIEINHFFCSLYDFGYLITNFYVESNLKIKKK